MTEKTDSKENNNEDHDNEENDNEDNSDNDNENNGKHTCMYQTWNKYLSLSWLESEFAQFTLPSSCLNCICGFRTKYLIVVEV